MAASLDFAFSGEPLTLDELNALDDYDARRALASCCGAMKWVDAMLSGRPYASLEDLLSLANEEWAHCSDADYLEAFSHHPRIGAKASGDEAKEQAGAQNASSAVKTQLAEINRIYERKFDHIYLVFASGKSGEEMLAIAEARLNNDAATELQVAAEEQRKITEFRLRKLIA